MNMYDIEIKVYQGEKMLGMATCHSFDRCAEELASLERYLEKKEQEAVDKAKYENEE